MHGEFYAPKAKPKLEQFWKCSAHPAAVMIATQLEVQLRVEDIQKNCIAHNTKSEEKVWKLAKAVA